MTALGYLAGALTTLSFLPQVVRSARMRSAAGLSWLWLLCFGSGVAAWAVYGVLRGDRNRRRELERSVEVLIPAEPGSIPQREAIGV